jgi:hypothetical protein
VSERTVIAVVSDLRKTGLTVEQQILVDEAVMLAMSLQAKADAVEMAYQLERERLEDQRAVWRDQKRVHRMSKDVRGLPKTTPPSPPMINNSTPSPTPDLANAKSIKAPTENPLFEEFWGVYPRKVEKGVARKAWKNALKRATPEEIIAGAKRYAAQRFGQEVEFTKHPGPWLNADRWLDEAPKVVEFASGPKRTWAEIKAEREGSAP